MLHWAAPWALLFFPVIFALLYVQSRASRRRLPSIGFSDLRLIKWSRSARQSYQGWIPLALIALAIVCGILALARPQRGLAKRTVTKAGIDIMMCLDTSSSMQAMDLLPNRLDAALEVSKQFVAGRPDDRIGLVVFAGQSMTACPLTHDHAALSLYLENVRIGATGTDGTAIGNGLATAINRLKKAEGKSKVIILLTDGSNNAGELDPIAGAKLAKTFGIRVYTIGAATRGEAPVPVNDPFGMRRQVNVKVDLDEDTLQKIAIETGGKYYRATDTQSLGSVYREINQLEKIEKPKQEIEYQELYLMFLVPATILLAMKLAFDLWEGEVA